MLRYLILILLVPLLARHQEKKPVVILKTGWYYISVHKNEYQRQLDRSKETYYIDPNPIVTANHFKDIEMSSDASGNKMLIIKFDATGTSAWGIATGRSIGRKLALIIGNKLIYTPSVDTQIDAGISALNRGIYSESELNTFLKQIKSEIK